MTREEAKRRLLNIERSLPNTFRTKEDVRNFEALEMAIKALEQEPLEVEATKLQKAYNKGFEDCRQAVDEIKELMTDINEDTVYAVRMSDLRQLFSVNPQEPKIDEMKQEIRLRLGLLDCIPDIMAIIDKYKAGK